MGSLKSAAMLALVLSGCLEGSGKTGVPGENDLALFAAPTELVFTENVTVGSRFEVYAVGRRTDDEAAVLSGSFASSDEDVFRVVATEIEREGEGEDAKERQRVTLEMTGAGEAFLSLVDEGGAELDRIALRGVIPRKVEVVDGTLLGSVIDARLPERIGLVDDAAVTLVVAATDSCGNGALDLGGVVVTALDPSSTDEAPVTSPYLAVAAADFTGAWVLTPKLSDAEPLTPRDVTLRLTASGVADTFDYDATVVAASSVDEVDVAVATAQPGTATVWGRAFTDDLEVIGLSFDWEGSARVTVDRQRGPLASVTISFPAEGEPADERPATVTAEVFGTEGDLDLLTLKDESELRTGRVPADDTAAPAPTGPSCGGNAQEVCDPYAAFALGALFLGKRLRRRRSAQRQEPPR